MHKLSIFWTSSESGFVFQDQPSWFIFQCPSRAGGKMMWMQFYIGVSDGVWFITWQSRSCLSQKNKQTCTAYMFLCHVSVFVCSLSHVAVECVVPVLLWVSEAAALPFSSLPGHQGATVHSCGNTEQNVQPQSLWRWVTLISACQCVCVCTACIFDWISNFSMRINKLVRQSL